MAEYGEITCAAAGRRGGEKVKAMGTDYAELGRLGGAQTKAKYGRAHYEELGRKGGEAVRDKLGTEHYQKIGKMGGNKVRELIERGKASQ